MAFWSVASRKSSCAQVSKLPSLLIMSKLPSTKTINTTNTDMEWIAANSKYLNRCGLFLVAAEKGP